MFAGLYGWFVVESAVWCTVVNFYALKHSKEWFLPFCFVHC